MPFVIGGGSGVSAGALSVRNDNIFANTIDRDDYFSNNPSRLVDGTTVVVNEQLQKNINGDWVDISPIIKGQSGTDAPLLRVQYSANGESGWSDTLNATIHKFWRWSNDGGNTWTPIPPNKARYAASADAVGGSLPEPFEHQLSATGKLQLLKDGRVIMEQDEYGALITNAITTGTGSLHFGDLHSIGSANENVVFKNQASELAWHPTWGAISADGTIVLPQTARVHGTTILSSLPAGGTGSAVVDYNSTFTVSGHSVFLYLDIIPKELYTGKLTLIVARALNNMEVSKFDFDANITDTNATLRVPFKYPLWMLAGQEFTTVIAKPDGSFLKVLAGADNTRPYRIAYYRTFTDEEVLHAGNPSVAVSALESLSGSNRLSASSIRDFPVMSNTQLGMAKLGNTMSINGNGELNTDVAAAEKKVASSEVAMLSLPQISNLYIVTRTDVERLYYLNANTDPAQLSNWEAGPSVSDTVASFNGRVGTVLPASGDYNQKQIKTIHDDTSAEGWFGIDNNGIYFEVS